MAYSNPLAAASVTASFANVTFVSGATDLNAFVSVDSTLNQPVALRFIDDDLNRDNFCPEVYIRANGTPQVFMTGAKSVQIKHLGSAPTSGDIVINAWS